MGKYKNVFISAIISLFMLFAITVPAAAANGNDIFADIDADNLRISDAFEKEKDDDADDDDYIPEYITQTNIVDIELRSTGLDRSYLNDTKVYINGKKAKPVGRHWELNNFQLQPGKNEITVTLEKDTPPSGSKTFTVIINYLDVDAPNSVYRVVDIFEHFTGDDGLVISAFNDAVRLDLGTGNAIMNRTRSEVAEEQNIEIGVYNNEYLNLRGNYLPVSRLYKIAADDEDYTLLNSGRLTLKYDTDSFGHGLDTLTVLYFKEYGKGPNRSVFENLGGVVDAENKAITVPFRQDGFGYYGVYAVSGSFSDFYYGNQTVNWANTYVMSLYAKNIMNPLNPYTGSFGLVTWDGREQPITQGEFATMLAKALNLPVRESAVYNHDYLYGYNNNLVHVIQRPYVEAALSHGLFNGISYSDTAYLTREQAAVVLARAANLKIYDDLDVISRITGRTFTDGAKITPWQRPYVYAAYRTKLINVYRDGSRYKFLPGEPYTRVQAAESVYKLMQYNRQAENN